MFYLTCNLPSKYLLFKFNNGNTSTISKIFSKLTIKAPEQRHWRHSDIFIFSLLLYFISRVLLNRALTCTQLHPPPTSSFQPPPSSFHPPSSSLQHPQQWLNQNIARNWAISPNFGRKIKSCPFWLKIGTHDILEMLIPNPDLNFCNSDPKIHFWANLVPKSQSCLFFLKIGTHDISKMLILIPTLVFWISNPNFLFGQIWT